MRIEANEASGETVILSHGDNLADVPESHQWLITPEMEEAFAAPIEYFQSTADRCPFPKMKAWLVESLARREWELQLHLGPYPDDYPDYNLCGFEWQSESVRTAVIELPRPFDLSDFPEDLQAYWSLVNKVHWNGFGCAGGLSGCTSRWNGPDTLHPTLSQFFEDWRGDELNPDETHVWGSSPCGDMVIYVRDGRGGWAEHGEHIVRLLGSIGDTIDHIYGKLMAGESPEWERAWYS